MPRQLWSKKVPAVGWLSRRRIAKPRPAPNPNSGGGVGSLGVSSRSVLTLQTLEDRNSPGSLSLMPDLSAPATPAPSSAAPAAFESAPAAGATQSDTAPAVRPAPAPTNTPAAQSQVQPAQRPSWLDSDTLWGSVQFSGVAPSAVSLSLTPQTEVAAAGGRSESAQAPAPTGAGGEAPKTASDLAAPTSPAPAVAPTSEPMKAISGVAPSTASDSTYLLHQVFLGGSTWFSPFNDDAVAPLTDMVYANDEADEQMGTHLMGAVPTVGSSYNGGYVWQGGVIALNMTVVYTISGGEFQTANPAATGWTIEYSTTKTVTGYASDILAKFVDQTIVVPYQNSTSVTLTATTPGTLIHYSGGSVTSYELTLPETHSASYTVNNKDSAKTVHAANDWIGTPVGTWTSPTSPPPTSPPPTEAASARRSVSTGQGAVTGPSPSAPGVRWSTLAPVPGAAGQVVFQRDLGRAGVFDFNYSVWQVTLAGSGTVLPVYEAAPQQPAATQTLLNATGWDITYNCHGYSLSAVNVQDRQGKAHTFWIDNPDCKTILTQGGANSVNPIYQEVAPKYATTGDVIAIYDAAGNCIHTMVLTTPSYTKLSDGSQFLNIRTAVASKDGMLPFNGQSSVEFELGRYAAGAANNVPNIARLNNVKIYHPVYVWAA